ncbi:MAG TPA: leucyl aminopeptidase [Solirubrobacteraceae bacterium]|nr:leucyl aminopeptidase [Solirubrobacteraceae bacterium]
MAIGLFEGEDAPSGAPEQVGELLSSGEARASFKSLGLTHAEGKRWLTVGLGTREDFTAERARVAAAVARERARELATKVLCWQAPDTQQDVVAALVEGTGLADYSFDSHKSSPKGIQTGSPHEGGQAGKQGSDAKPKHLDGLIVTGDGDLAAVVGDAQIVSDAVSEARDLQNRPANDLTPTALAEHARKLGEEIQHLSVEVEGRDGLLARKMGAFAAVAQGSDQEPALITMRYEPGGRGSDPSGPLLGFVGKAVTFDSGGISLKPGAKMAEMKFDMSGGAAVISALAAIARIGLPVRIVAVVGATENLPSGRSVKPGDIVTAANGKTIEVNNTDAEGRLVLADCLCHAISLGAEQVVDLATLTGAVIIALGSTYAGLISNDDVFAAKVTDAGEQTGEIVWRLPLHEEYDELVKGKYGDLDNAPEGRKAGTITGATFLSNFVGDTPWVHLDIAGSAWDLGRAYAPKGAAGYGVRLLVQLARSYRA